MGISGWDGCHRGWDGALLPKQPKYHLLYLKIPVEANQQHGPGFWENTSSDSHSRLSFVSQMTSTVKVFTHVDYPMVSNPRQESIAFFRRVFLPQMQFTLSGVIQSLSFSNLKKKSFFFSPLHPPHQPTAAVSAVCSLYR